MPQRWDPEDVLQLCNDSRCVGYAPSKGRKCRMRVRGYSYLITELAEQRPDADLLAPKLRRLAEHGLCGQYHYVQVDNMVSKWTSLIRAAFPPRHIARNGEGLERSIASSRTSTFTSTTLSRQSTSIVTSLSMSLPAGSEAQTIQDTIAATQETIQTPQQRPERLQYAPPTANASSSISRVSTSDISTLHLSRSSTIQSTTVSQTQRSVPPLSRPAARSSPTPRREQPTPSTPAPAPSPTSLTSTTPVTHSTATTRRCPRTHVRRLPLNEECPICYDDIPLSACDPSYLVWCRSGCGRSIHTSCFSAWRTSCARSAPWEPPKCVICRTPWAAECDCTEGCTTTHVRRRAADGNCSICQEDLRGERNSRGDWTRPELEWCKDGCGGSVHEECFETWRAECVSNGRAATCTDCRAEWVDGCEC